MVKTGVHKNDRVEMLDGLVAGDRVVTRGHVALIDGSAVVGAQRRRNRVGARRRQRRDRNRNPLAGGADMTLSDVSIQRPVLTWMMMLALVVCGVLGVTAPRRGPVPDDGVPGRDRWSPTLPGANPEGMEEDVTDVLEEHLNTIAGVRELRSTTLTGVAQIFVEFQLGTNLDKAIQDVRDEVAQGAPHAAQGDRAAGRQQDRTSATSRSCGSRSAPSAPRSRPRSTCAAR